MAAPPPRSCSPASIASDAIERGELARDVPTDPASGERTSAGVAAGVGGPVPCGSGATADR